MLVSSTSMNAASATMTAISQGLNLGRHGSAAGAGIVSGWPLGPPGEGLSATSTSALGTRSARPRPRPRPEWHRIDRHPQQKLRALVILTTVPIIRSRPRPSGRGAAPGEWTAARASGRRRVREYTSRASRRAWRAEGDVMSAGQIDRRDYGSPLWLAGA